MKDLKASKKNLKELNKPIDSWKRDVIIWAMNYKPEPLRTENSKKKNVPLNSKFV